MTAIALERQHLVLQMAMSMQNGDVWNTISNKNHVLIQDLNKRIQASIAPLFATRIGLFRPQIISSFLTQISIFQTQITPLNIF